MIHAKAGFRMSNIYDISGSFGIFGVQEFQSLCNLDNQVLICFGLWLALLVRELPASRVWSLFIGEYYRRPTATKASSITLINPPSEGKGSPNPLIFGLET